MSGGLLLTQNNSRATNPVSKSDPNRMGESLVKGSFDSLATAGQEAALEKKCTFPMRVFGSLCLFETVVLAVFTYRLWFTVHSPYTLSLWIQ